MRRMIGVTAVLACSLLVATGCTTTQKSVGGAVVGGAIGSSITGGSTLGTIGGAAAGGYVCHELGERYEERRR